MARYDIVSLEDNLQEAYDQYILKPEDQQVRAHLFSAIKNLTKAIIEVEGRKAKTSDPFADVDKEQLAYEYAVHLFKRILESKFVLPDLEGRSKFAWTPYIRLSLRHILWTEFRRMGAKEIPFGDLKALLESCHVSGDSISVFSLLEEPLGWDSSQSSFFYIVEPDGEETEIRLYRKEAIEVLCQLLEELYGKEKVERYLSYLVALSENQWKSVEGMQEFVKVLIALYKRLFEDLRVKFNPADIDVVLRSTLFLASILSSDLDRRVFVSLDLKNLYRLAIVCGGETIRIPTVEEIEDLIASAYAAWKMLKEGADLKSARKEAKTGFGLRSRTFRVEKYVKALGKFLSLQLGREELREESEESRSVVNLLLSVVTSLHQAVQQVLGEVERATAEEKDVRRLVDIYRELSSMLDTVQGSVFNMRNLLKELGEEKVLRSNKTGRRENDGRQR